MIAETYIAFSLASALVIVAPGPSVLVVVAHALAWGERRALFTILGVATSHALFFGVTGIGVAAVLGVLVHIFTWVKLAGAGYLVWLGIRQWRADPQGLGSGRGGTRSAWALFLQGFAVNTTNPKALIFYAAFFPQFVDPSAPLTAQLVLMGATFVTLLVAISFACAIAAARTRHLLASPRQSRFQNRLSGGLLIGAGIGLAVARRE